MWKKFNIWWKKDAVCGYLDRFENFYATKKKMLASEKRYEIMIREQEFLHYLNKRVSMLYKDTCELGDFNGIYQKFGELDPKLLSEITVKFLECREDVKEIERRYKG